MKTLRLPNTNVWIEVKILLLPTLAFEKQTWQIFVFGPEFKPFACQISMFEVKLVDDVCQTLIFKTWLKYYVYQTVMFIALMKF